MRDYQSHPPPNSGGRRCGNIRPPLHVLASYHHVGSIHTRYLLSSVTSGRNVDRMRHWLVSDCWDRLINFHGHECSRDGSMRNICAIRLQSLEMGLGNSWRPSMMLGSQGWPFWDGRGSAHVPQDIITLTSEHNAILLRSVFFLRNQYPKCSPLSTMVRPSF